MELLRGTATVAMNAAHLAKTYLGSYPFEPVCLSHEVCNGMRFSPGINMVEFENDRVALPAINAWMGPKVF